MEYNIDYAKMGRRIAQERKKLKDESGKSWTQEKLMEYLKEKGLGISRNTLSSLENGNSVSVDFNLLIELCKLFSCELGYLLCEEGYENRTRQVTDIVSSTGLSEKAVNALINANEQRKKYGTIWQNPCIANSDSYIHLNFYTFLIDKIVSSPNVSEFAKAFSSYAFAKYHFNQREHDFDIDNEFHPSAPKEEHYKELADKVRYREMCVLSEFMHFLNDSDIDRDFFREAETGWQV